MGQKTAPGSGSGMKNPDHISESLETNFWIKIHKVFNADPGRKKFGSTTLWRTNPVRVELGPILTD
jgi:hypothetical protein